jgi:small subunit ribosomal protein S5e
MSDADAFDNFEDPIVEVVNTQNVALTSDLPDIKLFGKWNCDDVQVSDISLQVKYFNVYPYISNYYYDV